MKKYCGAAAPNIRLACQNFRVFESTASDCFSNACKESALSIASSSTVTSEALFQTYKKLLSQNDITFETFQCHVLNKYEFKPKEKLLQDEPDSSATEDESDEETDSNNNQVPMANLNVYSATNYFSPSTEAELTDIFTNDPASEYYIAQPSTSKSTASSDTFRPFRPFENIFRFDDHGHLYQEK